ncbi:response regulator transcription factor [Aliiroseovarius sp. KMU-50]|uniref:Response regulator transcription factor n=1 Tax=Aliiroseovarius salicola TaxID=3009082 RepID=A0ABT4VX25_9RHOB|nr:response regulator transcription factor [Aliiroseovarius sp. KMU-50]MDA5092813.1 response regulator transcription factor [Aliiroseovarius sp. KMU-50]
MFGGDGRALAPGLAARSGKHRPTVAFVGNAFSFSDQIVRISNVEFDGVSFERFDRLEDLREFITDLSDVVAIILDEAMADQLPVLLDKYALNEISCQIVVGYRDADLAASIFHGLLKDGIRGKVSYLPMNQQFDIWLSIMRLLLCGGKYIPEELMDEKPTLNGGGPQVPDADLSDLTDREREVLALVSEGKPNKTIASELDLSEHTIKLHIHHVITKLGVRNRTEAAILYLGGGSAESPAQH